MANVRLPLRPLTRSSLPRPHQCLYQTSRERLAFYRISRFSTSPSSSGPRPSAFQPANRRADRGMTAPKTQQLEALSKGQQIPTDLGLVPQTFIMPRGANRPGWISDTRDRLSMEYYRWRAKVYNFYLSLHYKWFIRTREQKKAPGAAKIILNYPFRTGRLASVAEDLHRTMYLAAAAGDLQTLRTICADGTFAQLRAQISRRGPREEVQWECERVGKPKLVSHRATVLPFKAPDGSTSAIRQAVVRLVTRQKLRRVVVGQQDERASPSKTAWQRNIESRLQGKSAAKAGAGMEDVRISEGEAREMTEYFVIQRRLWKGAEEPWMVWGVTEETTSQRLAVMKEEMAMMAGARKDQAMGKLDNMTAALRG